MSNMSKSWPREFALNNVKQEEFTDVNHDKWNFIGVYYVNTLDCVPSDGAIYDEGLEVMHTEIIPLCANLPTEDYFNEISVEDDLKYMVMECKLHSTEPGYYKCVCGVKVDSVQSQSQDGVEWDTDILYEMISRTKLSTQDVDYIIDEHNIYPTAEEYAEIMANNSII